MLQLKLSETELSALAAFNSSKKPGDDLRLIIIPFSSSYGIVVGNCEN